MDKYIITITREFGSLGRPIAHALSQKLGIEYYDRDIVDEVAKQLNLPVSQISDAEESSHNHFFAHMFPLGTDKQYIQDMIFDVQKDIILDLARKSSCIIVGRCADLVLTGQDVDCLSLFICAPFEWRVHHRMELENLDEKAARALVEKTDAQREKYYTHYTGRPWGLPENYDICINSARLGIERTAALLAEHCRELFSNPC